MPAGRPPTRIRPFVVRVALYLRPGEDDDLIAFFTPLPVALRASAVKQGLRSGRLTSLSGELPSDADIEAALDQLLG